MQNHELREIVDRTDFRTRSRLLADEIATAQPDLIGLQEVALWRHGPMQLDQIGRPDATVVDYDFLTILLADLANRGTRYEIAPSSSRSPMWRRPRSPATRLQGTAGLGRGCAPDRSRCDLASRRMLESGSRAAAAATTRQQFHVDAGGHHISLRSRVRLGRCRRWIDHHPVHHHPSGITEREAGPRPS